MQVENRKIPGITRLLTYFLASLLKRLAQFRDPRKRLLIVKTDGLGDYILVRNFIEFVKKSEKYKAFKVDLLGNELWEDVAVKYDWPYLTSNVFIESEASYIAPAKLNEIAWRLFRKNYHTVLHPTYSRTFIADSLAAFTGARNIIGFEGDAERIMPEYKAKTDKFYTQLKKLPSGINFEFDKTRFFFESALEQQIAIEAPSIAATDDIKTRTVILVPGSAAINRNWEPEKFTALAKLILKHTNCNIIITGTNQQYDLCQNIADSLPDKKVLNFAGKTSASQFVDSIVSAALVVSNETSAAIIAAAVGTKNICLLGGGYFNRFLPYPQTIINGPICVYEKMDCFNCNWNCKYQVDNEQAFPCIAALSVENVWQQVKSLLE